MTETGKDQHVLYSIGDALFMHSWKCNVCGFEVLRISCPWPDHQACPYCEVVKSKMPTTKDGSRMDEQEAPKEAIAARRERQRLAWLQLMQGFLSSGEWDHINTGLDWSMKMYNERWESDD